MTEAERRAALESIAAEIRGCTRCRLHGSRTQAVPGEGHASTEVLFVGEAPGLNEDRQGRPFVGAAGQFLTELLGEVGWRRDDVFITNVVKCRPPQNRDPEPDEIAACAPYLRRQLEALEPALVVTLGRHSMGRFMPGARIGQVHGTHQSAPPELGAHDALVFAMYHPAAALHQGSLRQTILDDMAAVPAALIEARRRRETAAAGSFAPPAPEPPPTALGEVREPEAVATREPAPAEPVATPGPVPVGPEPAAAPAGPLATVPSGASATAVASEDAAAAGPSLDAPPTVAAAADQVAAAVAAGPPAASTDDADRSDQMTLF